MTNNEEKLNVFLKEFSLENLKVLPIEKYTGTGVNRKDFTYKIEWELDCFGGIKGGSSYKFGIYKCNSRPKERKGYKYDEDNKYAWVENYNPNGSYIDVYEEIRDRICRVAEAASGENVDYDEIQNIALGDAFKWKVAFLYSRKRLVPVYQKEALNTAIQRLGVLFDDKEITIANLQKALMFYYTEHKEDYDDDICKFGTHIWLLGSSDLSQSNQIIKYGAPGTGKTYTAKLEAEEFFRIWKLDAHNDKVEFHEHYNFVQFHPSYSYEDFIEGIKPVMEGGKTELKLTNGIFKSFCKKAAKYEIWLLKNGIIQPNEKNKQINDIKVKEVREYKQTEGYPFEIPETAKDDEPVTKYIPPFFFVIDEINRADLSRVFGELMYCLEYRGYEGRIKTQYSKLELEDSFFYKDEKGENWFFIPHNVYIIGTMNTIDRSIESFDFALRRRFLWQRIDPNKSVLQNYFEKEEGGSEIGEYIIPRWENLNKAIAKHSLLGPDYQIGHSYLMKLDRYRECTKTSYQDVVWQNHILPILEEYFRGMGGDAANNIAELKNIFCAREKKVKK